MSCRGISETELRGESGAIAFRTTTVGPSVDFCSMLARLRWLLFLIAIGIVLHSYCMMSVYDVRASWKENCWLDSASRVCVTGVYGSWKHSGAITASVVALKSTAVHSMICLLSDGSAVGLCVARAGAMGLTSVVGQSAGPWRPYLDLDSSCVASP